MKAITSRRRKPRLLSNGKMVLILAAANRLGKPVLPRVIRRQITSHVTMGSIRHDPLPHSRIRIICSTISNMNAGIEPKHSK